MRGAVSVINILYTTEWTHVHVCKWIVWHWYVRRVDVRCACVCVGFYFWMQMHLIFYCYSAGLSHSLFIASFVRFLFYFFFVLFFTDCFAIFSAIKWPFECHQNRIFLSRIIVDHLFLEYVCEFCLFLFKHNFFVLHFSLLSYAIRTRTQCMLCILFMALRWNTTNAI